MMKHAVKPFVIVGRLFTRSEEKVNIELDRLKDVAEYEAKQDQCGSYLCMLPCDGDKTVFTLFETYDSRGYITTIHRQSEAFKMLKDVEAKSDTLLKPTEAMSYTPKGGFLWREEPSTVPLRDQFIWIAKIKAHQGTRNELLSIILTHMENVHRDEKDTLSFLVLESMEDDVSLVLFERYTTEDYFRNTHAKSQSMANYREKTGPLVAEKVSEGFLAVRGFVDKREALV